jgi:hypothetical protein
MPHLRRSAVHFCEHLAYEVRLIPAGFAAHP